MIKEMKKQNLGITLVALVVTIIVLIILAGVSISLVLGDNGIITKAKEAKTNTELAQKEEEDTINELIGYIEGQGELVGPVEGGSYDNPYIPAGFSHTMGEGSWNSGYVIKEIETGNEFVWVPCVLDQTKVKKGDTVVTYQKTLPQTTETSDIYYKYNPLNLGLLPIDTNVPAEDSSVAEIEKSVEKYGGFYIARYEAGIDGTTENYSLTTKTLTDGSVKPLSQAGKGVWNSMSRSASITVSKAMIDETLTGVKSTLISGEAWDTTLQWMVSASDNKDKEPNLNYDINSIGKGWYSDLSNDSRHLTGYYAVNNIYDMAGNVTEWTTENCMNNGTAFAVNRGGDFSDSNSSYSVAFRDVVWYYQYEYCGFRVILYKNI